MLPDWDSLSDDLQLALGREALRRAAQSIAGQAECLAGEIECGSLTDRGGPEALRLLAAIVRVTGDAPLGSDAPLGLDAWAAAGHA